MRNKTRKVQGLIRGILELEGDKNGSKKDVIENVGHGINGLVCGCHNGCQRPSA